MIKSLWLLATLFGSVGFAFADQADAINGAAPGSTALTVGIGGPYSLIDQNGNVRTQIDPDGHLQLVFFGYANCKEICSAALPQMAEVAQALAAQNIFVTPVLITVDPVRDTVEALGPAMQKYGHNFVGLTGDAASLQTAYNSFSLESSLVFDDPFYGPVYAHGSFIYLLDAKGVLLTVIPPILSTDRVIDLVAGYAKQG